MAAVRGSRLALARIRGKFRWDDYDIASRETTHQCAARSQGRSVLRVPRAEAFMNAPEWQDAYGAEVAFEWSDGNPITRRQQLPLRPYQTEPVEQCMLKLESLPDIIFKAYTGSGKTVMCTSIANRLGRTTLIVVDRERLADQWLQTLAKFGVPDDAIGRAQGPIETWQWEGSEYVVAMVQSLYERQWPDGFDEYFGTLIVDEFDAVGTEHYSDIFERMPCTYRIFTSATERRDARKNVLRWHSCCAIVELQEARQASEVRIIEYDGSTPSFYANRSPTTGRFISELVDDGERNAFLVAHLHPLYEADRKILVIGERIAHLESLHALAAMEGIPKDDMLLYTGKENVWGYRKAKKPDGHPPEWVRGTEYTPVEYCAKERKVDLSKRAPMLDNARIIFTTYAVFSKGVDVPDIDTGFDVTPRSGFVQIHGRILRYFDDKFMPIWVTVRDSLSYRAEYQLHQRMREFKQSNVEFVAWKLGEGVAPLGEAKYLAALKQRYGALKHVRIVGHANGQNMLRQPSTENTRPTG